MFDLRSVRLQPGEQTRVALEVDVPPIVLGGETYVVAPTPSPVVLELTRLTNGLVLELRVDVHVDGICHRCLGDASVPVLVHEREFQADRPDEGAEEDMTSEYVDVADQTVAVERWASDAVVLALPTTILCREDCPGLCARCGADLNAGPCGCPPVEPDDRWARLRELLPADAAADEPPPG